MITPTETELAEKELPTIEREEDRPFPGEINADGTIPPDNDLGKTEKLKNQITVFRLLVGKNVLYISFGAMGVAAIIDLISSAAGSGSELVASAFEAFKLIAMTVLGYVFGSKAVEE